MIVPSVVRQRRTARIREEDSHSNPCNTLGRTNGDDSNIITLKPTLTLYFPSRAVSHCVR